MPWRPMPRTIVGMSDAPTRIRASDADRQRVAAHVQQASGEGRLTLDETEDRLGAVYAAKYLDELDALTADLPLQQPEPSRFPTPLHLHAAIVGVLSVLLVVRWVISGVPFFWPVVPMFWLGLSLAVHAAVRSRHNAVPY
ncbi:hypothetical protein Atai01_00650 [Amycolatopsis taiwanensis]|uniref:DUF1707 domain-containing protein n=2 Tax=Amycolatopsis taiwanensis TaxID=342230 RepID=A0A9W6QSX6_9PSEU|nr:hypothetical protein Atai01_00650 [Amycolatopsis taiwanensis]